MQGLGLVDGGVPTEKLGAAISAAGTAVCEHTEPDRGSAAPDPPYVVLVVNDEEEISARFVSGADAISDLLTKVQVAEEVHGRVLSGGMHDRMKADLHSGGHMTLVRLNGGEVQMGIAP